MKLVTVCQLNYCKKCCEILCITFFFVKSVIFTIFLQQILSIKLLLILI